MNFKTYACVRLLALFLVVSGAAQMTKAQELPETAAGQRLAAFLKAINSGDKAVLHDFHANNDADSVRSNMPVDDMIKMDLSIYEESGGLQLRQVVESQPNSIAVLLQARNGNYLNLRLEVEQTPPHKIIRLGLDPAQPPTSVTAAPNTNRPQQPQQQGAQSDLTLTPEMRSQVIDGVLGMLNNYYVFPEVAKKMEQAIRERVQRKEYDKVTSAASFASMLTTHLQDVSHDKHLRVGFSAEPIPPENARRRPSPEEIGKFRAFLKTINFGFQKAERMEGNIGYLDLRGFVPAELGADTAIAALNFLANTDSLIIDLRQNGGGDPAMVALISSYLFDQPTHLNDLYWREGDSTHQWWTLPYVPGQRYGNKDVYVLTSKRTFSAAEEFTYNLKNLKRATIIGETTGGGAHPGGSRRVNEHFSVWVPSGRAINPVSKTNWEGTGVKPDVEVPADQALKTAYMTALKKQLEAKTDEREKNNLRKTIENVEKEFAEMKKVAN